MRKKLSEKLKNQLLAETIYRCAYCLKNIEHEKFDIAHIDPYAVGGDESYENLIILCSGGEKEKKSGCHYKWDFGREIVPLIIKEKKGEVLSIEEKKKKELWVNLFRKLKNDWMFASGKYSRMELDLLFDLYSSHPEGFIKITYQNHELIGYHKKPTLPIKPWLKIELIENAAISSGHSLNVYFIIQDIHNSMSFLFRNIIENNLICFQKNETTSGGGMQWKEGFIAGRGFLTSAGQEFCKKFYNNISY